MLALMAFHGLRVAEVVGLQLEDVNLEGKTLTVLGKGRKLRAVHLVDQSVAVLSSWLVIRERVAQGSETAVFVSLRHPDPGTGLSTQAVRSMVDRCLRTLGLKRDGVSCHALRHSFATLSHAAGARLNALSREMGHASVTTTQVYADIVDAAAENPALFLMGALESVQQ
jgi:site-specific recombinase XerD